MTVALYDEVLKTVTALVSVGGMLIALFVARTAKRVHKAVDDQTAELKKSIKEQTTELKP